MKIILMNGEALGSGLLPAVMALLVYVATARLLCIGYAAEAKDEVRKAKWRYWAKWLSWLSYGCLLIPILGVLQIALTTSDSVPNPSGLWLILSVLSVVLGGLVWCHLLADLLSFSSLKREGGTVRENGSDSKGETLEQRRFRARMAIVLYVVSFVVFFSFRGCEHKPATTGNQFFMRHQCIFMALGGLRRMALHEWYFVQGGKALLLRPLQPRTYGPSEEAEDSRNGFCPCEILPPPTPRSDVATTAQERLNGTPYTTA